MDSRTGRAQALKSDFDEALARGLPAAAPRRSTEVVSGPRVIGLAARAVNRNGVAVALIAAALAAGMSGCTTGSLSSLKQLHALASRCAPNQKVAAYVAFDGALDQRTPQLVAVRLEAVRDVASVVAVCAGHLRVRVFSASVAASAILYDGELSEPGATENSRLLRVPATAASVVRQVQRALPSATRALTGRGRDPLGQLQAAGEYAAQLGDGYELQLLLETNGFATTPVRLGRATLALANARQLANAATVPSLRGTVTIAGLGRVGAGPPPKPALIDALHLYYQTICRRTGARCLVTSDILPLGIGAAR